MHYAAKIPSYQNRFSHKWVLYSVPTLKMLRSCPMACWTFSVKRLLACKNWDWNRQPIRYFENVQRRHSTQKCLSSMTSFNRQMTHARSQDTRLKPPWQRYPIIQHYWAISAPICLFESAFHTLTLWWIRTKKNQNVVPVFEREIMFFVGVSHWICLAPISALQIAVARPQLSLFTQFRLVSYITLMRLMEIRNLRGILCFLASNGAFWIQECHGLRILHHSITLLAITLLIIGCFPWYRHVSLPINAF